MKYSLVLVSLACISASCAPESSERLAGDASGGNGPSGAHTGGSASFATSGSTSTAQGGSTGGNSSSDMSGGATSAAGGKSGTTSGGSATTTSGGSGSGGASNPVIPAGGGQGMSGELNGLRWEALCRQQMPPGSAACPNLPLDNVCPIDAADPNSDRQGYYSTDKTVTFPGTPGVIYNVQIRVRGVVEFRDYANGMPDGEHFYIGGDAPDFSSEGEEVHLNLYSLSVSSPKQIYFLNDSAGGTGTASAVALIDQTRTIAIEGGASVRAVAFDRNCNAFMNCTSYDGTCTPFIVPGVPPYPNAFSGQFLQLDVLGVAPKN